MALDQGSIIVLIMDDIKWLEPSLTWFGHASFSFKDKLGNKIYYVDPFDLEGSEIEKADLIFITHAHYDHCSFEDVKKILKDDSVLIAPPDCLSMIDVQNQKQEVAPNKTYEVKGFKFWTFPAYNINKNFHPKENNWVGYFFNINKMKIYHAGDTDFIPEMKNLKDLNLDVAMLPIGGTYTMDVDSAIEAANAIAAKTTIPMHYKNILGDSYKDAEEKFKQGVTNSKVVVLEEVR